MTVDDEVAGEFEHKTRTLSSLKKFLWAQQVETEHGIEIRCTLCDKVFMKPNRKRKYDVVAFERHQETDKHSKAALIEEKRNAVDSSIHNMMSNDIPVNSSFPDPTSDDIIQSNQPLPLTTPISTRIPFPKSISIATWECFIQIVLRPNTLQTLGHDGIRSMVAHFKAEENRQSLQALIHMTSPYPEHIPNTISNRPNGAKFIKMYQQLVEYGMIE